MTRHTALYVGILVLGMVPAGPLAGGEKAIAVGAAAAPGGDKPVSPAADRADSLVVGVSNSLVPPDMRANLGLARREGVLIETVFPDSPAQKGGLLPRDVVLSVGGRKVARRCDLVAAIRASQGKTLGLELIRDGKRMQIEVTPVRRSTLNSLNMMVPAVPAPVEAPQRQVLQMYLSSLRLAVQRGRIANVGSWPTIGGGVEIDQGALREDLDSGRSEKSGCIDYECTSQEEVVRLEIDSTGYFACGRVPVGGAEVVPVEFVQAPGVPLVLTVGKDGSQVFRAATIWHLLVAQPEACRRHLLPLLAQFREDWELDKSGEIVESEVLKMAGTAKMPDRAQWPALVKQLGDNSYARRESADAQLRAAGPAVLDYLEHLKLEELDLEQGSRIRRIMDSLDRTGEETPEQVAKTLVFDPSLWLALLARPDALVRRSAAKQLEALLGSPIAVDPAADPATQVKQREELRARIEKIEQAVPKS